MGHSKISLFLCRPYHKKMYAHARMKTTLKLVLLYFAYQLLAGAVMAGAGHLWAGPVTTQLACSLLLSGLAMTVHLVAGGYVSLRHSLRPVGVTPMLCSRYTVTENMKNYVFYIENEYIKFGISIHIMAVMRPICSPKLRDVNLYIKTAVHAPKIAFINRATTILPPNIQ